MNGNLQILDDGAAIAEAVAGHWRNLSREAIDARGGFHVALAGGNTPRTLYQRLARADYRRALDWQHTHIYFGDERCVPRDHPDSNFLMAQQALLSRVPVPPSQVHPMFEPGDEPLPQAAERSAARYADLLQARLPRSEDGLPVFDLILLGMGDDGHTASLFPGTAILQEQTRPVAAQYVDKLDAWRISLTLPTINAARQVAILVSGESKAERIAELARTAGDAPDERRTRYPVQRVRPQGRLNWYLDTAAARLLNSEGA